MLYIREMRYSTSDLSRKSGDIIAHAMQAPVTITQRGKPRLVLLSVDEYNRLRGRQGRTDGFAARQEDSGQPAEVAQTSTLDKPK